MVRRKKMWKICGIIAGILVITAIVVPTVVILTKKKDDDTSTTVAPIEMNTTEEMSTEETGVESFFYSFLINFFNIYKYSRNANG